MTSEPKAVYELARIEVRQLGRIRGMPGRRMQGMFRYGETATIAASGRTRKERIEPGAFRFAIEDENREINLLLGHEFSKPLATTRNGSLALADTPEGVVFTATLPDIEPSYMRDAVDMIEAGLIGGISPGFAIPPSDVVPGAEELIPEPGNPGVLIRSIRAAVLYELSLVTRPAYPGTEVDTREMLAGADLDRMRSRPVGANAASKKLAQAAAPDRGLLAWL